MTRPAPNQLPLSSGPAPAPQWRRQGNPLFESRKPLPLERAAEHRATEDELVQRARDRADAEQE